MTGNPAYWTVVWYILDTLPLGRLGPLLILGDMYLKGVPRKWETSTFGSVDSFIERRVRNAVMELWLHSGCR